MELIVEPIQHYSCCERLLIKNSKGFTIAAIHIDDLDAKMYKDNPGLYNKLYREGKTIRFKLEPTDENTRRT